MILEIDVGNTRLKWRLRDGIKITASGVSLSSSMLDQKALYDAFADIEVSLVGQIYISSVVSYHEPLLAWCESIDVVPIFASVEREASGVCNGYDNVAQMGIDRWLGVLAASKLSTGGCLIVDAGSAMTIDLLRADGIHCGGYIVPGLRLMNQGLFNNTGGVKVDVAFPEVPSAGTSTVDAVMSGLPLMLIGLIKLAISELRHLSDGGGDIQIVMTGGDGFYLAQLLPLYEIEHVKYVPELVLDGLQLSIAKGVD